jgi:hypothetical protein
MSRVAGEQLSLLMIAKSLVRQKRGDSGNAAVLSFGRSDGAH